VLLLPIAGSLLPQTVLPVDENCKRTEPHQRRGALTLGNSKVLVLSRLGPRPKALSHVQAVPILKVALWDFSSATFKLDSGSVDAGMYRAGSPSCV